MRTLAIRDLMQSWRPGRGYYRDPKSYWEARHGEHQDSLQGPGCIQLGEEANRDDYEAKWDQLRRVLEREVQAGATRILDAGCGTGWFTRRAAKLGFAAIDAVDFSATAAEIAQRNAPTSRVRVAELDQITSIEPYDVVMCIDVLFHVVDEATWARSVRNLAALACPKGALVIQDSFNETGNPPARHVRYRSLPAYERELCAWQLEACDTYVLPNEVARKDLMVFRRVPPG
jgi:2-polyprenyl-3-methyl-5-hydroxy-6-metoxy-1,4-benzoquinol methylase